MEAKFNFDKKTFTFKKTDQGLELKSDVYLPQTLQPDHVYTVIVHYHGGGLIIGDRDEHSLEFVNDLVNENWIYLSIDYRLCPEVKIYDMWNDCEDHWKWVITELPTLLNIKIDESNIASIGESAGGYLSLLSGYKLHPRPKAIVAYFAISAIDSDYYNKSKDLPPEARVSEENYKKLIEPKPTARALCLSATFEVNPRGDIFKYLIQEGIYTKTLWGLDIHDPEEKQKLLQWKPAHNFSKDYPPIIIFHGDKDPLIPFTESEEVVESLKKNGTVHEFVVATGLGHGFFVKKGDGGYEKYIDSARLWLKKYLTANIK